MKTFIIGSALLLAPTLAFADLAKSIEKLTAAVGLVIPLLMSLAVVAFFWGLVKYIANADDEGAKESGKTLMIWGMVALFVMVAFWGIIGYFQDAIGLTGKVKVSDAPAVGGLVPM
jgi:hypothetical protein